MKNLGIKSIVIKKYRPTSSKKKIEEQENSIKLQNPTKPLILHSDLGCQYTSSDFEKYITDTKIITHSFSSKVCHRIMLVLNLFMTH